MSVWVWVGGGGDGGGEEEEVEGTVKYIILYTSCSWSILRGINFCFCMLWTVCKD